MSTQQLSNTSCRPKRNIRKSMKARESGCRVPGIDTSPNLLEPSDDMTAEYSAVDCTSSTSTTQHRRQATMRRQAKIRDSCVFCPRTTDHKLHDGLLQRLSEISIYFWEYPYPSDFLCLNEERKAWKMRIDSQESTQGDASLDDWMDFVGEPSFYDQRPMEMVVARTLINRAKRAFRRFRPWSDFEAEEIFIDSTSVARAEPLSNKRRLRISMALDNDIRLAVFDALKVRLCREIWLQEYPGFLTISRPQVSERDSVISDLDDHTCTVSRPKVPMPAKWTGMDLQKEVAKELETLAPDHPWWRNKGEPTLLSRLGICL